MSDAVLASEPRTQMPHGWAWRPIASIVNETIERAGAEHRLPVLSVTKHSGIVRAESYFKKAVHGRDTANYKVVRRRDLAYATIHLDEGSVGVLENDEAGIVSPMYTVMRASSDVEPGYLFLALKRPESLGLYRQLSEGTVNRRASISFERLGRISILLPPVPEQRKIAAILSSVDDAIESTQAVIDQLGVVKKAMTAEFLTRGLPGRHTKFKQTEIGEVPEGWEVVPLGDLIASGPDNGLYKPQSDYGDGTSIVRIDAYDNGDVILGSDLRRVRVTAKEVLRFGLRRDEIVVNRVNSLSHIAKAAIVGNITEPTLFESNMMRLSVVPDRILPSFAFRVISSSTAKAYFVANAKQAVAQASINQQDVRALPVPVPPLEEQRTLVGAFEVLDERLSTEKKLVGQLALAKATLMSVLLTGELRVTPDESAP